MQVSGAVAVEYKNQGWYWKESETAEAFLTRRRGSPAGEMPKYWGRALSALGSVRNSIRRVRSAQLRGASVSYVEASLETDCCIASVEQQAVSFRTLS